MRRSTTLTVTFLFLAGLAASADEPARKPDPKKERASEEEVLTFTSEDLERKYGPSTKAAPVADGKAPDSKVLTPLQQLQAQQDAGVEKAAQREKAAKRVEAAQARVAELQRRRKMLRNPLLGRAQPEAEEKEAWAGADQAGRLKMTDESLAAARKELEQARKELNELR